MSRVFLCLCAAAFVGSDAVPGQVGEPGISFDTSIAAGQGVQMYPYDQQEPWLHGHYQRVPAYGGFSSFRPYNYRHVLAQRQIAAGWGAAAGLPYSHQFWNRYRGSYLNGSLHSQFPATPLIPVDAPPVTAGMPGTTRPPVSGPGYFGNDAAAAGVSGLVDQRPVHVFPAGMRSR